MKNTVEQKNTATEWKRNLIYLTDRSLLNATIFSAGDYQADERAGVARLSCRVSGR